MTNQKISEAKIGLAQISADGNLEEVLQNKVNQVARMLIGEFSAIAKEQPLEIGRMAKAMVLEATKAIANS